MRTFTTLLATVATVILVLPQSTQAFIAWSGSTCDGAQGNNVPCDGSCHSFEGRHSFKTNGGTHCVTMYEGTGCPNGHGDQIYMHTFAGQTGGCQNVNTGTPINSFRCAPNNICLV